MARGATARSEADTAQISLDAQGLAALEPGLDTPTIRLVTHFAGSTVASTGYTGIGTGMVLPFVPGTADLSGDGQTVIFDSWINAHDYDATVPAANDQPSNAYLALSIPLGGRSTAFSSIAWIFHRRSNVLVSGTTDSNVSLDVFAYDVAGNRNIVVSTQAGPRSRRAPDSKTTRPRPRPRSSASTSTVRKTTP